MSRHLSEYGAAFAGWCSDSTRVRVVVRSKGGRSEAWLTPGQARALAIKLLTHAERAQRKGATALRLVRTEAKAKDIARDLLTGASEVSP